MSVADLDRGAGARQRGPDPALPRCGAGRPARRLRGRRRRRRLDRFDPAAARRSTATRSVGRRPRATAVTRQPATRAPRRRTARRSSSSTTTPSRRPAGWRRWPPTPSGTPSAAVVGAKLLYPTGTVQHAGVVIGQDGYPHNLYAGLPGRPPGRQPLAALAGGHRRLHAGAAGGLRGGRRLRRRLRQLARGRRPLPADRRAPAGRSTTATRPSSPISSRPRAAARTASSQSVAPLPASVGVSRCVATTSRSTPRTACSRSSTPRPTRCG